MIGLDAFYDIGLPVDVVLMQGEGFVYGPEGEFMGSIQYRHNCMFFFDNKGTPLGESGDVTRVKFHLSTADGSGAMTYMGTVHKQISGYFFYGLEGKYLGNVKIKRDGSREYFDSAGAMVGSGARTKPNYYVFHSVDGRYLGNIEVKG